MPPFLYIRHNNYMRDYSKHISIIGAGIGGLALGNVLKKNDIPCVIYEKSEKISGHEPAGVQLLVTIKQFPEKSNLPSFQNFRNLCLFYISIISPPTKTDSNVF